eukprot:CAMPEP_0177774290 /NCGR_PEP_ID=MMETSP0491_2-20121128/13406_1 /TAXON_ID=63592 /ORGANISM="Tetraselmis chuii, Strain PLY429" /LENGTH=177 /DNA_ID=CAMNT_0019292615 /DNA_START=80 /DNA_END=613 /DNA_ORIENTATION=-
MVANAGLFVALAHDLEDADSIAHHRTVHRLPRPKSFARLSGNAVHVRQHLIPPTRDAPPRCQLSPSLAPSAVAHSSLVRTCGDSVALSILDRMLPAVLGKHVSAQARAHRVGVALAVVLDALLPALQVVRITVRPHSSPFSYSPGAEPPSKAGHALPASEVNVDGGVRVEAAQFILE